MKLRNLYAVTTLLCIHFMANAGDPSGEDDQPFITQVTKVPSSECVQPSPQPDPQYATIFIHTAAADSTVISSIASLHAAMIKTPTQDHLNSRPTLWERRMQKRNYLLEFLKYPKVISD